MKKISLFLLASIFVTSQAFAKSEFESSDAESVVLYGKFNGALVPLKTDANGVVETSGGSGTPGGSDTQVQYNDAGVFGGDTGLVFNETTNVLTVAGDVIVGTQSVCQEDGTNCPATGGGDSVTVNTTAIDTTANFKDTTTVTWAVIDGGAGGPDDVQATAVDVTCTNCLTTTEVASADLATNVADTDFGDVTVASGAWAVEDDSHAHTGSTISGLDISSDTNLTAGDNLTLTDDDLDLDAAVSIATSITSPIFISNNADPADAGIIRLGNTEGLAWEVAPAGADATMTLDASEVIQITNATLDGADLASASVTATELGTDSVSADELNATGVESELEAALDIAGDVSSTGMASTVIGSDKVLESMLKAVDAASDENILTFESTTGDFEWHTCAEITGSAALCDGTDADSGGATAWSSIGDAAADADVAFLGFSETISGNTDDVTAIGQDLLSLNYTNDAATDILVQRILVLNNVASANGVEAGLVIKNSDTDDVMTDGILFDTAAGAITTAVNATDAEITTALAIGSNVITTGATTIASAELDRLDGLSGTIVTTAAGTATLATALAANGANCSAGNYPLGVDASGAVETCTAVGGGPTYREFDLSPAGAVLDDGAPPDFTVLESTGTGTSRRIVADFDPTTDQILYWTFVVPSDMTSGDWLLDVNWFTNDTGANEDAIWYAQMSCTSEGDADSMAEDAAGSANTGSENCNATEANRLITTTITLSNLDSVAVGDSCTVIFGRDADDSIGDADNDGLSSDARLINVHVKMPRA